MAEDLESERDGFQTWLAHMDDFLDEFRASAPPELVERLDFSSESLDAVEAYALDVFADMDAVLAPEAAATVNALAIYVGETMRKIGGGVWDIELTDKSYAFYGRPILRDVGPRRVTDCPMTLVTASVSRRAPGYIRKVVGVLTSKRA